MLIMLIVSLLCCNMKIKLFLQTQKCGVMQVEFLREHTHMHTNAYHTENGWIDILSEMDQI